MMKKILVLMVVLLVGLVGMGQSIKKMKIGEVDTYIKKSKHPVVVSFWATWCAPCVEEIPWLQEAVENHKGDSVELILISLDYANLYPKKINEFIKEKKFRATSWWLNETNADLFCPVIDAKWDGSIPVTLLVNNKTGYRKFVNRQMTDRQVEPEIQKMLTLPLQ
jgi:thiol-disulfide isomerase/thioredoxin